MPGLVFHHLGLAVKKPEAAASFLKALGYEIGSEIFDPLQNVNLIMATHAAMPDVEIIWPAADKGPLDTLLSNHRDGLVYHMCYTTGDLAGALKQLEKSGVRALCVVPAKAAILFGGRRVSFYMIAGVGLIEIIEDSAANH